MLVASTGHQKYLRLCRPTSPAPKASAPRSTQPSETSNNWRLAISTESFTEPADLPTSLPIHQRIPNWSRHIIRSRACILSVIVALALMMELTPLHSTTSIHMSRPRLINGLTPGGSPTGTDAWNCLIQRTKNVLLVTFIQARTLCPRIGVC